MVQYTNFVNAQNVNIGAVSTKGLDFTSHYHMDIGAAGKLAFNFSGTYTKDFETQPLPSGGSFDCAGYWARRAERRCRTGAMY